MRSPTSLSLLLCLSFAILGVATDAAAQASLTLPRPSNDGTGSAATEDALSALRAAGNTVIVVPPEAPAATGTPVPVTRAVTLEARIADVRRDLTAIVRTAPELFDRIVAALFAAGGGSLRWLLAAGALSALAFAGGALGAFFVRNAMLKVSRTLGGASINTRAGRIGALLTTLARQWAMAGAFFVLASLIVLLVRPVLSPERVTAAMAITASAIFLAVRGLLDAVLSPRSGAMRLFPISDGLARSLYVQLLVTGAVATIVAFICYWLAYFPLAQSSHQLLLLTAPTASALLFVLVLFLHRRELTAAILGQSDAASRTRRLVALAWPGATLLYLVFAWALTIEGVVLDSRLAFGPVLSPFLGFTAALVVWGGLIIVLDLKLAQRIVHNGWTELYERAALGLAGIVGTAVLAGLWRLYDGAWADATMHALGLAIVLLVAWFAWRAVRLFVEIRMAEEQPAPTDQSDGEGFGVGGSRLGTLLPIVRNVALFFIASVVVMVVLSSLGVNVAPLFAGAGVVGLAIGFGAQTLIRDVFSGAFFLFDDAFRRGEYVEVGDVRGMVEKISVRSFQLRHHNGPLHTIPFGEIKQLTNYSRDWVIMKLPIRLTYDTDVEKVRKLVKTLGQEMAANPEYGHLFMEPPKSQGVIEMDDSAMIVRIKFKTRPGNQFILRRHVYQRVRELFTREGIAFAHRQVTVRVEGTDDPEVKRRASGAALRTTDDAAAAAAHASDLAAAQ